MRCIGDIAVLTEIVLGVGLAALHRAASGKTWVMGYAKRGTVLSIPIVHCPF